jgi:hypothetical protein
VLYDTLLHLSYNRDVPVYHTCMSIAYGLDECVVSVMIPLNPVEPWMATIIGIELDDTIERTAQVTLSSLCCSHLADVVVMLITLFLIHYRRDPVWEQRLEAISDLEGPHFHIGMAATAEYA